MLWSLYCWYIHQNNNQQKLLVSLLSLTSRSLSRARSERKSSLTGGLELRCSDRNNSSLPYGLIKLRLLSISWTLKTVLGVQASFDHGLQVIYKIVIYTRLIPHVICYKCMVGVNIHIIISWPCMVDANTAIIISRQCIVDANVVIIAIPARRGIIIEFLIYLTVNIEMIARIFGVTLGGVAHTTGSCLAPWPSYWPLNVELN